MFTPRVRVMSMAAVMVVGTSLLTAGPVSAASGNLSKCTTNSTGKSCETLTSTGLTVKAATGTATTKASGSGQFILTVTASGHAATYKSPVIKYSKGTTVTWTKKCPGTNCSVPDESTFSMVFVPKPAGTAANGRNTIAVT